MFLRSPFPLHRPGRPDRQLGHWILGICWGFGVGLAAGTVGDTAWAAGFDVAARAKAAASITSTDLNRHLSLLADDAFEGREAGSRGGHAAGNYLAQQLPATLEPAGESGQFYQTFGHGYRNLLAVLPGADANLRHEYILVGAHYDHVGYGQRQNSPGPWGVIHNGADDNASGTAALLEVLQAFATSDVTPRRSILFAFWDGEEKGLLGSEHWVQHPTVPWQQVRLVINADMVGRLNGRPLEVQGTRTIAGLRHLVTEANRDSDLPLNFAWKVEPNSDHYSFYKRQVPFVMFHTGLHDDYHRPSDDTERIDWEGLQAIG
ncbi:MAG: M20/M25/M40 family metallo-hydrolase, partial [Planctomycetales bacterium]|nr:M20/M25/M40 family metallo-hydrolase [Planctomycetales bacterium]